LDKSVELYFFLAHCVCTRPNGSNNDFISIGNHVPNVNCEVGNLLHHKLKPLRTFLQIMLVVAWQFMIVKIRSHVPENGLNISMVYRFKVTPYKLPVCARLIHVPLCDLIELL